MAHVLAETWGFMFARHGWLAIVPSCFGDAGNAVFASFAVDVHLCGARDRWAEQPLQPTSSTGDGDALG